MEKVKVNFEEEEQGNFERDIGDSGRSSSERGNGPLSANVWSVTGRRRKYTSVASITAPMVHWCAGTQQVLQHQRASLPVAKLGPVSHSTQDQGLQTHVDVNCRYLPGLISVQIRCEGGYNATYKLYVLSTDGKQDYSGNFPSKWKINI